jgi:hypothetical protein
MGNNSSLQTYNIDNNMIKEIKYKNKKNKDIIKILERRKKREKQCLNKEEQCLRAKKIMLKLPKNLKISTMTLKEAELCFELYLTFNSVILDKYYLVPYENNMIEGVPLILKLIKRFYISEYDGIKLIIDDDNKYYTLFGDFIKTKRIEYLSNPKYNHPKYNNNYEFLMLEATKTYLKYYLELNFELFTNENITIKKIKDLPDKVKLMEEFKERNFYNIKYFVESCLEFDYPTRLYELLLFNIHRELMLPDIEHVLYLKTDVLESFEHYNIYFKHNNVNKECSFELFTTYREHFFKNIKELKSIGFIDLLNAEINNKVKIQLKTLKTLKNTKKIIINNKVSFDDSDVEDNI